MALGVRKPQRYRAELQERTSTALRRRRAIIAVSLTGMASMAIVSLYQTGLLRHLPDPPLRRFDSDRVNSSDIAYHFGVPDGTVSLAGHAVNVVLAAAGDRERTRHQPWLPLIAAGKAAAEAVVAARYLFYQMPVKERAWCGYCIVDALAHLATFTLTLPEAAEALTRRSSR